MGFCKFTHATQYFILGVDKTTAALKEDGLQTVYEVIDHI